MSRLFPLNMPANILFEVVLKIRQLCFGQRLHAARKPTNTWIIVDQDQWRIVASVNDNALLQWRYNEHDGVSNHQPHNCLLNRSFRCTSKKISKLRVTGLCDGNSPVNGEFPAQRASSAKNVAMWWRHHVTHRGRDIMAAIFLATFSNEFSWVKIYKFWLRFLWNLFLGAHIAIS